MRTHSMFVAVSLAGIVYWTSLANLAARADEVFSKEKIVERMRQVREYQLARPWKETDRDWIRGTYYTGVMGLYRTTGDPEILAQALRWAEKHQWAEGGERERANKKTCGQTYLELYFLDPDPQKIEKIKAYVDSRIELIAAGESPTQGWYYCDTLYVGPPTIAMLGKATGDPKYYDYLNRVYWAVTDLLYDEEYHLFYRDAKYFDAKTPAGRKVFWSRGNGWVLGGLPRILQFLPKENEHYPRYVKLLQTMAAEIASRQGADGLWRANLDDPAQYPNPETSGTAFFCYAMAWGVNNGLLERDAFVPVVMRAWGGLVRHVDTDGKLGYVQPVGAEPKPATAEMTHEYGMGLFLLAGEEMVKLLQSGVVTEDEIAKFEQECRDSGLIPAKVEERPYLDYVRECVDLLMRYGTDRYGTVQSPLLMNILDVRSRDCPEVPLALDEAYRVTRRDRRGPAGGNLYADQATIRTMFLLSRITGEARYAEFARSSVNHTMTKLVDDKGFFWWGWHRHYDAYRDTMTGHNGNHHEIHIQQIIWPELWSVNPDAVTREIEAIWEWHIVDKETGECNRHGDRQPGCDFAMSGGEILYAFAFLFSQTQDRRWLDRAALVADYYWNSRHPQTNLIPNRPNAGSDRFDGSHFDTSITAYHCRSLLAAFELTGERRFRDYAVAYLKAYHDDGYDTGAKQFWGSLKLDGKPVPGPRVRGGYEQYEPRGYIDLWQPYAAGYEHAIPTAQVYAYAYQLTKDAELLLAAKRWADCIRREFPPRACMQPSWYGSYAADWAPHGTYAGLYGGTLSFLLHLYRLTGDEQYLVFARKVGQEAVSALYYRGLFRGHPCKPYYESIDGVGYLLFALLQLDRTLESGVEQPISPLNW